MAAKSLHELIDMIGEPHGSKCRAFLDENRALLEMTRGSSTKHQSWPGGYLDHITETMNVACSYYNALKQTGRTLEFDVEQALHVLFWHDVEKPWKQAHGLTLGLIDPSGAKNREEIKRFAHERLKHYSVDFTPEEQNAFEYIEGELGDYNPHGRVMGPLAAFCHLCDMTSARIFHQYPLASDDPWGAQRSG